MKKVIFSSKEGFTLIETLVTIAIIGIIGVIMVDLLFRTVSGGNKTQLIDAIKQNGQNSLSSMQVLIQSADSVVCPQTIEAPSPTNTATSNQLVVVKNGLYTRFTFIPNPTSGQCSGNSNGCIEEDNPTVDPTQIASLCASTPSPAISNPLMLTDPTIVSLTSGTFNRNSSLGYKDIVGISFILNPAGGQNASANATTFTSSVELK